MFQTSRACAVAVGLAVLLAGCGSPPAVHLHTLMPSVLPSRDAALVAVPATPLAIDIRLPSQVEQPQLLVRQPDDSLVSLEQERWASPLRDEIRQALFEELGAHAGIVEARSAVGSAPIRVSIDYRRFDSMAGREARIEGSWTMVTGAAGAARTTRCDWLYREPAAGAVGALSEAHRRATVKLADAIGDAVNAQSRNLPVVCPGTDMR